ncbi:MAG: putative esterase [Bacteriovoracaceae bacterium]|jgi:predicted esterase
MKLQSELIYARSEIDISQQPKTDFKIMLVMHGLGDSLEPYKIFTQEVNVTNCHYLLLNAPEDYYGGFAWYQPGPAEPMQAIKNPVSLIVNEIKALISEGFKKEDILLCGFSQGGCMALAAAMAFGEKLGGVIALSPKTYPPMLENIPKSFLETPLFIAHGEEDSVIPFTDVKQWVENLSKHHDQVQFQSYSMAHEIDIDEIHDLRDWLNEYL